MNINGIELDFDISDVNDSKNYEEALEHYKNRIPEIQKIESSSEIMEYGLSMLRDFFYEAIGTDIIADVTSFRKALTYYNQFLAEIEMQTNELYAMMGGPKEKKVEKQSNPGKPRIYKGGARPPKKH